MNQAIAAVPKNGSAATLKDDPPQMVEVRIGDQDCRLFWDGRAFQELKVNPFKPVEMAKFWLEDIGIDVMASIIRAGLLWEYRSRRRKFGEEPPSVKDVLDFPVDLPTFTESVLPAFAKSLSIKKDSGESPGPSKA